MLLYIYTQKQRNERNESHYSTPKPPSNQRQSRNQQVSQLVKRKQKRIERRLERLSPTRNRYRWERHRKPSNQAYPKLLPLLENPKLPTDTGRASQPSQGQTDK